jgi:hypothetical protein
MELDEEAVLPGCEQIYHYLKREGQEEEAAIYARRYNDRSDELQRIETESVRLSSDDNLLPHSLAEEELQQIVRQLAPYKRIKKAFLIKKSLRSHPEFEQYFLGIVIRRPWYMYYYLPSVFDKKIVSQVAEQVRFPRQTSVFPMNDQGFQLKRRIKKIPGSLVYRR